MQHQKGIALIQVLLICAIISVLGLYMTMTARQQVSMAQLVQDRTTATLALRTAQSRVLFNLLTQDANAGLPTGYNVYGVPFEAESNVFTTVQDVAGLIGIQAPDESLLRKVILNLGADKATADTIVDSLLDWQDRDSLTRINGAEADAYAQGPRNQPITLKDEIRLIRGMTPPLADALLPLLTVRRASYFNPMLAPAPILRAYLNSDANDILQLRQQHALPRDEFIRQTGIQETEGLILSNSKLFEIKWRAVYGGATVVKTMTVALDPYARSPEPVVEPVETDW